MANIKARGIIIKQSNYGDGHRLLSIFAEDCGIIKAVSYGALKSKTSISASSQFLCYGDFNLYQGTKHLLSVNGCEPIDAFYPISEDIKKLSLAAYMSDITYGILGERNADNDILRLYLNSVYALAYRGEPPDKVKTVYELKLMALGGYAPKTDACVACGNADIAAFDFEKGGAVCTECTSAGAAKINDAVRAAISRIVSADVKKMLSFNANKELLDYLNKISEKYVSVQLDSRFKSLEYYNSMPMS
ncbi:MAG: DNA repair protein RecO [Firmicutes bacterium]|nr:DNA repair protein RecO [Bacillota bacterium]